MIAYTRGSWEAIKEYASLGLRALAFLLHRAPLQCLMPSWNLEALRQHLYSTGHKREGVVPRLVRSVERSIDIFHFHGHKAHEALKETTPEGVSATTRNIYLALGGGTIEERQKHYLARLATEAHLIGAVLMARIMFDQFSQIANQLLLNPPMAVEDCDLRKLQKRLPPSPLKDVLGGLLVSPWFLYVDGFNNTAKHRELIRQAFNVSMPENFAGVYLAEFEYRGIKFPSYLAPEVLKGAFEVKNKIVDSGRALNDEAGVPDT